MTEIQVSSLPSLVTLPNVDILATGPWNLSSGETTFTVEDLANGVQASQCPAIGSPVLKLGHVDPRFDGEPAVGRVANMALTASGNKITGDLAGMPAWLGVVLSSAYPKRSIEGYWDFKCQIGHTHPFVISALALLGVTSPGVGVLSSLSDVAALYGVAASDGGTGRPWKTTLGGTMPPVAAAGVTTEDVRRAYYDSSSTPMSWWITELQLAPDPQLIVCDEASADIYRVPITIKGTDVSFGDPVQVQIEYQDVPDEDEPAGKKAASRVAAKWLSAAESRPVAAAHAAFDGTHSHAHPAMGAQGGDDTHDHEHTHSGDAQHDHHSAATSGASMNPTTAQAADQEVAGMQVTLTDAEAAELRAALGKGPDAELTGLEVLAALKARDEKATQAAAQVAAAVKADQGTVRVDAAQWAAVQADVQAGREARQAQLAAHRDTVISAAIGAGKFPPARKQHFEQLWAADAQGAEELIGSLAEGVVPLRDIGQGGGEPGTAEDAEYAALFGEPASK